MSGLLSYWVPEDGEVAFWLAVSSAKIGIDLTRANHRMGERERDIRLARGLTDPVPAAANLCAVIGKHPKVWLFIRRFVVVCDDADAGFLAESQSSFKITVFALAYIS